MISRPARTAAALLLAALVLAPDLRAASAPPVVGSRGMVASPEREAGAAGLAVLRSGGNAVDAAIATAFALAVTLPRAGNLGGGGFLLYRAPDGSHQALDFRETAPTALTAAMFRDTAGAIDPKKSREGGLAIAVPGSVAGLAEAHARWGTRPWAELLAPAIELAERGVVVSAVSARIFAEEGSRLAADPAARAIFTKDGAPLAEGARLVQKDLAKTLRGIAERGPKAFYEGAVAKSIADAVAATGGVMTEADLAAYRAAVREPLTGSYRGRTVVAFPPPSSGGVVLLQSLGMLERFDLAASGPGSSLTLHRIAEALRRGFADRSRSLGDPDRVTVPVAALLEPAYLRRRSETIHDDRATPSSKIRSGPAGGDEGQTLHLSIADARGGAVALTTTLNSWFGAAIVAPGTGVLLNNEIDDFALAPGTPNQWGLVGEDANAVEGGKRPLSSMCPTIVESQGGGRPLLVVGSRGGATIISQIVQVIVHVIDDGMTVQEAVDAPRIHHQWLPDTIAVEPRALPADIADALRRRGHTITPRDPIGNVCAIGLDASGRWTGSQDPREESVALGY